MSRTDKDAPDWVTATWWKPWHNNCQYATWRWMDDHRECDLPPGPVHRRPRRRAHPRRVGCIWEPISERRRRHASPPAWFINHRWNTPQRMAARVAGLNAAKEYRATGDTDITPVTRQHRHGATWDWS